MSDNNTSKDNLLRLLEDRERAHDAFRLAETAVAEGRAESYSAEMSAFDIAHGEVLDWLNDTDHLSDLRTRLRGETPPSIDEGFQARVYDWMRKCFQTPDAVQPDQRAFRFIEEALEAVQASGTSREDVLRVVEYVYSRPPGIVGQEIGGVMVTLAGLATSWGLSLEYAAQKELERCEENTEKIRAKDLAKPKRSPLPQLQQETPPSQRPLTPEEGSALRGAISKALEPVRTNERKALYEQKAAAPLASDEIRDIACCDKFVRESASEFCAECGYTNLDHLRKHAKNGEGSQT